MGIHSIDVWRDGQTEEHIHVCSDICQRDALVILGGAGDFGAGDQARPDGTKLIYGAIPGGCETDYDVWCAACGAFLWHGLNCECPDTDADRGPVKVFPGELLT